MLRIWPLTSSCRLLSVAMHRGHWEGFKFEDGGFEFDKCGGNCATFSAAVRVKFDHAGHCLVEVVAVLFFEGVKEGVKAVLPDLEGVVSIDVVAILEGAA